MDSSLREMTAQTRHAYFLLGLLVIIWGTSWPINKIGLAYISPLWFSFLRLVVASVFMLGVLLCKRKFYLPERRDLGVIFTIGLFQIGLFTVCMNLGLMYIGAGRAAFLAYTSPFWMLPIAILFFGEKLSWSKGAGFVLGLSGVILLFPAEIFHLSDHKILMGNGYLLLAAVCLTVPLLHVRYGKSKCAPLDLIFWQLFIATIFVGLVTFFADPNSSIHRGENLFFYLFYTGVLATGLGFLLLNIVSKSLPVTYTSFCLLGVPFISLISSLLLLHEQLSLVSSTGMLLISLGLVCYLR